MSRPLLAIVDTGSGNLRSVENARVTSDPDLVGRADKVVVPGQGAFGRCMDGLARGGGGLRQAVLEAIGAGKPFLGLCVGMQILFEGSEEDPGSPGLGLFPGRVVRFALPPPLKVPHMGWNECSRGPAAAGAAALRDTPDGTAFYFVHSYYALPTDDRHVALAAEHGVRFCAAVARDNLFASQFHPEKSQTAGLALLARFVAG
jgi:imidazole glycerol-phosphate synthase subunit HisH